MMKINKRLLSLAPSGSAEEIKEIVQQYYHNGFRRLLLHWQNKSLDVVGLLSGLAYYGRDDLIEELGIRQKEALGKALEHAACAGRLGSVKLLVGMGAQVQYDRFNAFRKSSMLGHIDIIEYFIEHHRAPYHDPTYTLSIVASRNAECVAHFILKHNIEEVEGMRAELLDPERPFAHEVRHAFALKDARAEAQLLGAQVVVTQKKKTVNKL